MPFVIKEKDELEFMRGQAALPARVVGLVFPVLIDRRITALLKARWQDDSKCKVLEYLFREGGPIGAADTRVRVGLAMRLYDETMYRDLRYLTDIRNRFAHWPDPYDFDSPPVSNWVNELKLPSLYPNTPPAAMFIYTNVEHWKQYMLESSGIIDDKPRRNKFLRTVEIILTHLAIEADELNPDRPIKPPGTGVLST